MTNHSPTSFARARDGNVAVIFAISVFPAVAVMGAAIDYSRASSASTQLQSAVDEAALALAKLPADTSQTTLKDKATEIIQRGVGDSLMPGTLAIEQPERGTNKVTVKASAKFPTRIAGGVPFLQTQSIPLNAASRVEWGNTRLRVALALDVTGSMAHDGKMGAMKAAAQNLLKQLKDAAMRDGDVYVSIVPFAKDVNAAGLPGLADAIKWSGASDTWEERNGACLKPPSCNSKSKDAKCGTYTNKAACQNAGNTWTPAPRSTWNGCVMDRDRNYDTTNTAPAASADSTLFPAEQYAYCPSSMMGLSYNWTDLGKKINALQPSGGTNQGIGLAWAFQSLTAAPFTVPAMDPDYNYSQVIILLSDGLNTQNRYYGDGANPSTQVDDRQRLLCDNVKKAGIKLFTVHVNTATGRTPESALLRECASDSSKFFHLTSSDQIVSTFNQIGTHLSGLHVAR